MIRWPAAAAVLCIALGVSPLPAQLPLPLDLDGLHRLPGDPVIARSELHRSMAGAQAAGDSLSQAYVFVGLAFLEERAHQPENAEKLVREASQAAGQPLFLGRASMWLAQELSPLGKTSVIGRSRAWLQVAVEEFRRLEEYVELARALRAFATLMNQGMAKRQTLEEALSAARKGGNARDIAVTQADWGESLRLTGDLAGAIEQLNTAIARLEALEAWPDAAKALALLGRAYGVHGRYREADAALVKGEAFYERAGDPVGVMQIRGERGTMLALAGDRKRAVEILDRVREYSSVSQAPVSLRIRMAGVAFAYLVAREYEKAVEAGAQVLRQFSNRTPAVTHWVLSAAYFHLGRYQEAVVAATAGISGADDSVVNQRESHRWRALSLERLGRLEDAALDIREAVRLDDSVRGRLLPDDDWKRTFEDTRTPLAQDAIALLWRAGRRREALEATEVFRARAFLDLLASREAGVKTAGGELASAAVSAPASVDELSAYAVRSGVTVLSYWVHPEAVYVWLISPQGAVSGFRTPVSTARLTALVDRVRSLSYKPDRMAWQALYRILIQPVRDLLPARGKTLAVVPHGALFQLPFTALTDASGRYLVEDYGLLETPAAALLLASQDPRQRPGRLLLVGDPVTGMASLPGAGAELRRIASLSPGNHTMLNRRSAVESRFRAEAPLAGIVHFATHAVVDSQRPFDSYLALSNGDKLTAGEVYDLSLHAGLVMLSACRSGSGRISSDGLLGLTRAFLYAGAARVIAPVWDVPDEPTALLVGEFYRRYLAGVGPARALRAAQLKLLADLRAGRVSVQTPAGSMTLPEHPALWAGFILQGAE